jgi:NADPH:quinone reductase-like Zn-dependent oxidoreductase
MKAITYTKYGSPDVLKLKEVEKPVPKGNEVLIKIHAGVVTPADCAFRKGDPFIARFFTGLFKPKNPIPGIELSGEIEAVGKDVTLFKKGDAVFGASVATLGTHAEYKCLPEKAILAIKPTNITYDEATSICDGAITALYFLRDTAHIQSGQKVLIHGASGAVGTFAVQLAKYFGAEVTAVCSTPNVAWVKSLGADTVIDYTASDFTKSDQTYHIIFDAVGKSSFSRCKGSLTQKGIYLSTVPTLAIMFQMLWTSMVGTKKAVFVASGLNLHKKNLIFLAELMEAGKIKAVIDRRYPLEQIAEAHSYVEKGHKKGTVLITIDDGESQ